MLARWRLGDGSRILIACNLAAAPAAAAAAKGDLMFESVAGAAAALASGTLPAHACVALMEPATEKDSE